MALSVTQTVIRHITAILGRVSGCYVHSEGDVSIYSTQTWQVWVGYICLAYIAGIYSDAISEETGKDLRFNKSDEGVPWIQDRWVEYQECPRQTRAMLVRYNQGRGSPSTTHAYPHTSDHVGAWTVESGDPSLNLISTPSWSWNFSKASCSVLS